MRVAHFGGTCVRLLDPFILPIRIRSIQGVPTRLSKRNQKNFQYVKRIHDAFLTITSFEFLISFMHRHRWHVRDHAKLRQFEKFRSTRKQYPAKYRPDHETCWCGYHCHFHDGYRRFRRGSFNGKCKAESFSRTFSSYFYLILLFFRNFPHFKAFAYTAQWGFLLCLYFKLLYLWRVSLWIYDGLKAIGTAFLYATNIAITPQTTTTTNWTCEEKSSEKLEKSSILFQER